MPPKTIKSNLGLGEAIRNKRNELNLTIEEAASKAGIGTKTWSRYESGESIRKDKVRGLCKALNWATLPEIKGIDMSIEVDFNDYKNNEAWSPYLTERFGKYAALSFVIGSESLFDEINTGLAVLSEMPRGSHIGEVSSSFISRIMPGQFLMRYDYEFMWALRETLIHFRKIAPHTRNLLAHSVIEELVLYLIAEESRFLAEEMPYDFVTNNGNEEDEYIGWAEWIYYILGDMDLIDYLYSGQRILTPADTYHFDNWFEQQFYVSQTEGKGSEKE